MNGRTLKGALVGCGRVAGLSHMPAWRSLRDAEIVAVCDKKEELAKETAVNWNVPKSYGELSEMLQKEKLDFVDICAPPQTHLPLAIEAMEAGLHVIMEKPIALSLSEADEIVSVSKNKGVKLCVIHNQLFYPVIQKARSLIKDGAIGEVLSVEAEKLIPRESSLAQQNHWFHGMPGGALNEFSPHLIYVTTSFIDRISAVKAIARKRSEYQWVKADELIVSLDGEKGNGYFFLSCNSPRFSSTYKIIGTEATLYLDMTALTITRSRAWGYGSHKVLLNQMRMSTELLISSVSSAFRLMLGRRYYRYGHQAVIRKFVGSIKDGSEPPVSAEDGREVVRVLDEIWSQIG